MRAARTSISVVNCFFWPLSLEAEIGPGTRADVVRALEGRAIGRAGAGARGRAGATGEMCADGSDLIICRLAEGAEGGAETMPGAGAP